MNFVKQNIKIKDYKTVYNYIKFYKLKFIKSKNFLFGFFYSIIFLT